MAAKYAVRMSSEERELRERIVDACRSMNASGLNQGTSGNISARFRQFMLITPSGMAYDAMKPEQLARLPIDGDAGSDAHADDDAPIWEGPCKPSSEWHFHRAILRRDPACGAVVHTHSTFATVLSMAQREIPACHYMVAAFGGNSVRCADYATYGTPQLSTNILNAMHERCACLMSNHGMVVAGVDLAKAMWLAVELETLARQFYHAALAGSVVILPDDEIRVVLEKFKSYGLRSTD